MKLVYKVLPFFFLSFLTINTFAQVDVFDGGFISPNENQIYGVNEPISFQLEMNQSVLSSQLDYIVISVFGQGDSTNSYDIYTINEPGDLNEINLIENFGLSGNDIISSFPEGAFPSNHYTLVAKGYVDSDGVDGGSDQFLADSTYIDIYIDNDQPSISSISIPEIIEPKVAGDTLVFQVSDDFLDVSYADFTVSIVLDYGIEGVEDFEDQGRISILESRNIIVDTTRIDTNIVRFSFLLDLTPGLLDNSSLNSSASLFIQFRDDGNNEGDGNALFEIADNTSPEVELLSVDGNSPDQVIPNSVNGLNNLIFRVEDEYLTSNLLDSLYLFELSIADSVYSGTKVSLQNSGILTISDSLYIFSVNLKPYEQSDIAVELSVTDVDLETTTEARILKIGEFNTDEFYLLEPYPNTAFNTNFTIHLAPYKPSDLSKAIIEFSSNADFTNAIEILELSNAQINQPVNFDLPANFQALIDGQLYYIRARVFDPEGSELMTTRSNPIIYDESAPNFEFQFIDAIEHNGSETIFGNSTIVVGTDDVDLNQLDISVQRILLDTTEVFHPETIVDSYPLEFEFNSKDYDSDGKLEYFDGTIVFRVISRDNLGNQSMPQYTTVAIDNISTNYIINSVNEVTKLEDENTPLYPPVYAGDNLQLEFQVFDDDIESAEFLLHYYLSDSIADTIMGTVAQTDSQFSVSFLLPDHNTDESINLLPGSGELSAIFTDIFGNTNSTYIGTPNIGSIQVLNNEKPWVRLYNDFENQIVRDTLNLMFISESREEIINDVDIEYAIITENDTSSFSTLFSLTIEEIQESELFWFATTQLDDGEYLIRTKTNGFESNPNSGFESSFTDQAFMFRIDNTHNGTTERVTILEQPDATLNGSENITLSAGNGGEAYAAIFEGMFSSIESDTETPFVVIDTVYYQSSNSLFTISLSSEEISSLFSLEDEIEGFLRFRTIGVDSAGIFQQIIGNTDDASEVNTIEVYYDNVSPKGEMIINDIKVSSPSSPLIIETWDNQSYDRMNVWNGTYSIGIDIEDKTKDFSYALVNLSRYAAREPGNKEDFRSFQSQSIAQISVEDETFNLNTSQLVPGAIYNIELKLIDNSGNIFTAQSFDFAAIGPRAHIVGMSDEHGEFHVQATPQTASMILEFSLDEGETYQHLAHLGMESFSLYGEVSGYDSYKTTVLNFESFTLPYDTLLFRITAGESAETLESNFQSSTVLEVIHEVSNDIRSKSLANVQGRFTPIINDDINLTLYKAKGELNDIRVEVAPINVKDDLSLFFIADENIFSTLNDLKIAYYPRWALGYSAYDFGVGTALESIDGNFLGFLGANETLNLRNQSGVDISNGGTFYAYASSVMNNGRTVINRNKLLVNRIAASNGGFIESEDGNFTIEIDKNTLDKNASLMIEEDPAKLYITYNGDKEYAQLGTGYYLNAFESDIIRNGYRIQLSLNFDETEVSDIDNDGSLTDEILSLQVGYTLPGQTELSFDGILNKRVDPLTNSIHFQLANLPSSAHRYVVVQEGVVFNDPGSILIVQAMGDQDLNFVDPTSYASLTVSDQVSTILQDEIYLLIDGIGIEIDVNEAPGIIDGFNITSTETFENLGITEGSHSVRFIVPNNNGNKLDVSYPIILDKKPPILSQIVESIPPVSPGESSTLSFLAYDQKAGNSNGSGINLEKLFVDVYLLKNVVTEDSLGNAQSTTQRVLFKRYNPGEFVIANQQSPDSLMISFDVIANDDNSIIGYAYIPHNGDVELGLLEDEEIQNQNIFFDIENYTGFGVPDNSGNQSRVSLFMVYIDLQSVGIQLDEEIPTEFFLSQNYPNPFNPNTTIEFGITESDVVTLKVFDMLGREVATLVDNNLTVGHYSINFDASNLSSGMYIYRLQTSNYVSTKQLMLIK